MASMRPDAARDGGFDCPAIQPTASMEESIMSALNGDKARFNRLRKQKLARRKRSGTLLNQATAPQKRVDIRSSAPSRPVAA